MKVLILGAGGREHAIAWKISQSEKLTALFCAPGNPGTASIATNIEIELSNFAQIKEAVLSNGIEMVIVGPEAPLVKGLGDYFSNDKELNKIYFIGPNSDGAKLEGSKDFAKAFMQRYNIPTASYSTFDKESIEEAMEWLEKVAPPYVIKADGLAAGKGVVITESLTEAKRELYEILNGRFGEAGSKVVLEEYLSGIELSMFIITDGSNYMILPEAKDYKRALDGDLGLNTGGMGAVSPVPFANKEFKQKVEERVIVPTLEGLKKEGIGYCGFIFIGLMNCNENPYVIEYNVRLGDPETEAILPRVKSDLLSHLIAVKEGTLAQEILQLEPLTALTLVMVSKGYPQSYTKGFPIETPSQQTNQMLFHAGTTLKGGEVVTSGGRVMALTQLSPTIAECREKIYNKVKEIYFQGITYRRDIGADLELE